MGKNLKIGPKVKKLRRYFLINVKMQQKKFVRKILKIERLEISIFQKKIH